MHLTPEICRAAYSYLRACPPFRRWALPVADEVEFVINASNTVRGKCLDDIARIELSGKLIQSSHVLIETLGHELIHLYLNKKKVKAAHGKDFQRCAAQVCREHGFNK